MRATGVRWESRPLTADHDVAAFECGEPLLDAWLRDHALTAEAKRTSRTFVWADPSLRVLAYYTLSAHRLVRADLPRSVARGNPAEVPAVLLGKLALDSALHGGGHGGVLLADALLRVVRATAEVAARFVVVDALNERAATFYEHYGFRRAPHSGGRLVQKISDVAASLGG